MATINVRALGLENINFLQVVNPVGNGDLLSTNNLSELTNKELAFNTIKQAANSTSQGVMIQATSADIQVLTTDQAKTLPVDFINDLSILSTAEVSALSSDDLLPARVSNQMRAIRADELIGGSGLSTTFTTDQLSVFATTDISGFSTNQLSMFDTLGTDQIGAITTNGKPFLSVGIANSSFTATEQGSLLLPNDATSITAGDLLMMGSIDGVNTFIAKIPAPSVAGATITELTPVTASSTSITFNDAVITGAKQVIFTLDQIGFDAAGNDIMFRLGDSGGIETTGYNSTSSYTAGGVGTSNYTTSLQTHGTMAAANDASGLVIFTRTDSSNFLWSGILLLRFSNGTTFYGATSKALTTELTQVQMLSSAGANFDTGKVNITIIK